jgi:hypothetical protein
MMARVRRPAIHLGLAADLVLAVVMLAAGIAVAAFVGRHYTAEPHFYQEEFGPAVMIAAGRGFVAPVVHKGSPLDDFLHRRRATLSLGEIGVVSTRGPNLFQNATRYLMSAVGWWWRVAGISWRAVWAVTALMYGLTIVAAYAIFRVWLPRTLAAFGALFICLSSVYLTELPNLRDFSKAPFMLAALPLAATVALRPLSRRALLAASTACGAIIGIGIGFRSDVAIVAPLFLLLLVLFRGRRPWAALTDKALAAGVFLCAYGIAAAPIVLRVGQRGNIYHVILLGYSEPYYANLRIKPATYAFGLSYSDAFVTQAIGSYSEHVLGKAAPMESAEYERAGRAYWFEILRHFPADVVTRAWAASNGVMNLAFENREPGVLDASLPGTALFERVFALFRHGDGAGIVLASAVLIAASLASAREALCAAVLLLTLTAYPSLEFERRHAFHLEFISVLVVLALVDIGWREARQALADWRTASIRWLRLAPRAAVTALVMAGVGVASIAALRQYQVAHLRRLFAEYLAAPKTPVQPQLIELTHGASLMQWNGMKGAPLPSGSGSSGYFRVDIDGNPAASLLAIGVRYSSPSLPDLSKVIAMPATTGVNTVLFPVYDVPGLIEFRGLEIATGLERRIRGIYRIDTAWALPLPLDLALSGEWEHQRLYETLKFERADSLRDLRFMGVSDHTSQVAWSGRLASPSLTPRAAEVDVTSSRAPVITANGIEMDAPAEQRESKLLTFKPVALEPGGALVAQGRLESGGLAVGLSRNGQWQRRLVVSEAGNFVVVLTVDEAGLYRPELANAAPKDRWRSRFVLTRFGAISPP